MAGVFQVFFHQLGGIGGIARFDGRQDGTVEGEGVLKLHQLRCDQHHFCHGAMNVVEEVFRSAVSGGLKNGAVEEQVRGDELELVVAAAFKIADGPAQHGQIFPCGTLRREGGQAGLHQQAEFGEVFHGCVVEQEEKLQGDRQQRGGVGVQVAAVADALRDHAKDFKDFEGLA